LKEYTSDGRSKLFDVTEHTKEILQGCRPAMCVLTSEMFALILKHVFGVPCQDLQEVEMQIMNGNDFTEHIFKNDDLVRI